MKRVLLAAVLAFSLNVSAQIEEVKKPETILLGEVKPMGAFLASLNYVKKNEESNFYFITYRNIYFKTLTDIKSLSFYGTEKDLNNLYFIMNDLLLNGENKASKDIKIGNKEVVIMKSKMLGMKYLMIYIDEYNYFNISLPQLNQLFNKQ